MRYWKEPSRTIQIAGIGSKACRRRNRVPSRSFSTLNRAESSYPVKSNRLLIKNGPTVKSDVTVSRAQLTRGLSLPEGATAHGVVGRLGFRVRVIHA